MKPSDKAAACLTASSLSIDLATRRQTSRRTGRRSAFAFRALIAVTLGAAGCATQGAAAPSSVPPVAAAADPAEALSGPPQSYAIGGQQRLQRLWQERTADGAQDNFALGPGDVLQISVPLEQLHDREVRISPRDTITLPLVGMMEVGGMNEQELTAALRVRLSKYMHDPPVSLFVKHYGSREVAVIGAVEKPGLYTLSSGSDTLLDMLSKAGGAAKDAANNVVFVPAGSGRSGFRAENLIASTPDHFGAATPAALLSRPLVKADGHGSSTPQHEIGPLQPAKARDMPPAGALRPAAADLARLHPIVISMTDPQSRAYLEIPARPGDVLLVPAAGEVTVGGWVRKPGAYQITPGMTALSAISAAGGAMFSSTAEVLRSGPDGQRETIALDIPRVQTGAQSDVGVESGDVVMVDRSAMGALPYAAYEIFRKFGTGMYLPIP